jgi:hypothetical protein
MTQQVGSLLWQAAANAASVAGLGGGSMSGGEAVCEGCSRGSELPDTSAVLMSLLALYPGLRKLEVYTKVGADGLCSMLMHLPRVFRRAVGERVYHG